MTQHGFHQRELWLAVLFVFDEVAVGADGAGDTISAWAAGRSLGSHLDVHGGCSGPVAGRI